MWLIGSAMPLYEFSCEDCEKRGWTRIHEVYRPISQAGKPYACPNCGSETERVYSATVPKEFFEFRGKNGERVATRKQDQKYLRKHGRVLTQETSGWKDIQRMAKDGQRRTQLSQKGHY